ncbi:uncharacterized protein LOC117172973 [Belonocnema kinseyi]|uniref:uncharacterized protein LOC117172973 n=1 Tax=Belonocnema kinseyi TaxID=2817044 RepID=UPI00143CE616|nr:uncharacterized protein LOC117172973 [Belonocnema kinseyi]
MIDLTKMKIHVCAVLLTLAIYFSFIELSSQYNKDQLKEDVRYLPAEFGVWYNIKDNGTVELNNGQKEPTHVLTDIDGDTVVSALEIDGDKKIVRPLMIDKQHVKVDSRFYYNWDDDDAALYELNFNEELE